LFLRKHPSAVCAIGEHKSFGGGGISFSSPGFEFHVEGDQCDWRCSALQKILSRKAAKTQRNRKGKSLLTETELKCKNFSVSVPFLPRPVSIAFYESGTGWVKLWVFSLRALCGSASCVRLCFWLWRIHVESFSESLRQAALRATALLRPQGAAQNLQSRRAHGCRSRGGSGIDVDCSGLAFFGTTQGSRLSILQEGLHDDR
jgi:hypothetical protein